MRRRATASWLALAGGFLLSTPLALGQQMKFERTVVRDPTVGNLEGATLLVPEGWKLEGGFVWTPRLSMQANLLLRVSNPATGTGVDFLPSQQFNYPTRDMGGLAIQPGSNWNGSILLAPPRDATEFVQGVLATQSLAHLRGARLLKADDLPKLAAEHARAAPPNFTTRCTRLRYAFEAGGRPWEEDVTVTLTFAPLNGWTAMGWCGGTSMRAPAGQLDRVLPVLAVPIRSLRLTLAWYARLEEIRKVFTQGRLKEQEDFARFQQAWTQHQAQIQENHRQAWEQRAASQERRNFAVREYLGGVETYKNPYESRNVELPPGYKNPWVSNQGTVILSHDADFDPRPGSTGEWSRMERRSP